LGFFYYRCSL